MDINQARKEINKVIAQDANILNLDSYTGLTKLTQDNLRELMPDIKKLKNLSSLGLDNNQFTEIPNEIAQLQNLTSLSLSLNQIKEIPKEIGQLKKLKILYLYNNQIQEIPKEIRQLKNLQKLSLFGNEKLEEIIPREILQDSKNPEKILNYYFKIKTDGTRPINEAKIVVIGEANVGKTCLINRLIFDKVLPTKSTHGIEISQWEDVEINNEKVRLNVWDFGGQELMHSTHQFFFTTRTIYILVINARENEDNNKVDEWLKRVESFGGNSPVIIVGNKVDENDRNISSADIGYFDINRRTLAGKYKNIKGFYGVCSDNSKIKNDDKNQEYDKLFDKFRGEVLKEIAGLEGLNQPFPSDWYAVKQDLEEMQKKDIPYISYNNYISECVEKKVKDEISQKTIVEFLNEIGTVIYFKDLPDTMVFNPEWITKGVYAIIDNPSIVKNKGELEISQLKDILNRKEYPPEKHKYILDIMRKFELCVDIERDKKFLIPDLLPLDEVYTGEWNNTLCFQFHYETYLKSIFTKFIVRIFPFIHKKTYWRNGVVLELEETQALVKADGLEKKVTIQIQGSNIRKRQKLLGIVYSELDQIHGSFTFRKPDEFVAHPEIILKDGDGKERPLLKDYKELIGMEDKGIKEAFVKELSDTLPISDWLDGISSKEERDQIKETEKFSGEPNRPNKEDYEIDRQKALLVTKKNEIDELKKEIGEIKDKIEKYDEEAKTQSTIYSLIFLFILLIIIGTILYFVFTSDNPNTKVALSAISIVILIITYVLSGLRLKEWSPAKFPEQILAKEKERLYGKFGIDTEDFEFKKNKLKDLAYDLRQLNKQ